MTKDQRVLARRVRVVVAAGLLAATSFAAPAATDAVPITRFVALTPAASTNTSCAAPGYNTIQAAVDAASAGDTIHICAGTYNLLAAVTIGVDLTLQGDGRTQTIVQPDASLTLGTRIFVAGGHDLTIRALTSQNGFANGEDGGVVASRNLTVMDVLLLGVTVDSDDGSVGGNGGAIAATGNVRASDSTIKGLATKSGGAIYAPNGTVTLSNDTMEPAASNKGGAVYAKNVAATDTLFRRNKGSLGGGAIFATESVTATRTTFDTNGAVPIIPIINSKFPGGAINAPTVTVTDCIFVDNLGSRGGAIFGTTVTVTNSTFARNFANVNDPPTSLTEIGGEGGAIYAQTVTATDTTFDQNFAIYLGAGIDARNSATLTRTTFTKGLAGWGGAALTVAISLDPTKPGENLPKGTLTIDDSTFGENRLLNGSGGAIAFFADPSITDSTFTKNRAEATGGFSSFLLQIGQGGSLWGLGNPTVVRSTFDQNHADVFGGAYYSRFQAPTVENSTFSGNSAGSSGEAGRGGAIASDGATLTNSTFVANSAGSGGTLSIVGGNPATITQLTGATLAAGASCTLSVEIMGAIRGLKTNVVAATSAETGLGQTSTATVLVTDSDLTISKSHVGTLVRGRNGAYTITVGNVGPAPTWGTVKVLDPLPLGMSGVSVSAPGWSCSIKVSLLECSRSNSLAVGASYPAIVFTVMPGFLTPSQIVNVATVSGGGDANTANNSGADPTTVASP